ncbi:uncharacterized protein LOC128253799 [Drosophila gunungcola]|uniref:uncharacterized protein LOC128253799 n=1 Tax=Drosophila gunungcola TaxID=103775 RepID=UPI0022E55136|nr:uncharacterized protein LOC128253799 [Drosophila gunungcola]
MKLLSALVLLMTVGPLFSFLINPVRNDCAKRGGITPTYLKDYPTSTRVKCFYACELERLEVIVNGVVGDYNLAVLNITEKAYENIGVKVKPCLTIADPNKCELGYKVFQCLHKNFPEP